MQDRSVRFDNRGSTRTAKAVGICVDDGSDGVFDVGGPILGGREPINGSGWGAGVGRGVGGMSTAWTRDVACHEV